MQPPFDSIRSVEEERSRVKMSLFTLLCVFNNPRVLALRKQQIDGMAFNNPESDSVGLEKACD